MPKKLDKDGEDASKLGKVYDYTILRTGDRDLKFTGKLIGEGQEGDSLNRYDSKIYMTEGGKFIAARWHTVDFVTTYKAEVCDSPESVAQFFHIVPKVAPPKRGKTPEQPVPFLCTDGKAALALAASFVSDFTSLHIEEIK